MPEYEVTIRRVRIADQVTDFTIEADSAEEAEKQVDALLRHDKLEWADLHTEDQYEEPHHIEEK